MPSTVTLTVTQGAFTGRKHVFTGRTTALIGRDPKCHVLFPKDREHQTISRFHCLLDVNPPAVGIRDLGSRTGTYVNGQLIGKRDAGESWREGVKELFLEIRLQEGDEINVGGVVLRVSFTNPITCTHCSAEISDGEADRSLEASATETYVCTSCQSQLLLGETRDVTRSRTLCPCCGRDLSSEEQPLWDENVVCAECREDPQKMALRLVELAETDATNLVQIQGYRIERELGRGGMGAVYLAVHEKTGEKVALKIMLPKVAVNKRARDMFLREANNTKCLRHDNLVHLHDLGCSEGTFYFTLEYCEGKSLADALKHREKPFPVAQAVPMILQVLDGLNYAHQVEIPDVRLADGSIGTARGLVHRDVKPQNVFLAKTESGMRPKLGDYGLAKAFDLAGLSGMSITGAIAGTPVFMPRQQLIDYVYVKPEVDVWATAATLYYLLTLEYPRHFPKGKDPWQVVLQKSAVPIRKRRPAIPSRLAEVIDAALVDEPEITFKSAQELIDELEDTL